MNELTQIAGTLTIALAGALGLYIAADVLRFHSYGRDALRTFAIMQFWFVGGRIAFLLDIFSRPTSLQWSGLGGGVMLAILVNLIALHELEHRTGVAADRKGVAA